MAAGDIQRTPASSIPLWRDIRFWQVFLQIVFLIAILFAGWYGWNNIVSALDSTNQTPNFTFLTNRAGFDIGGADSYTPDDSFFEAFLVGVRNTLSVVTVGLVAATLLGVFFGIFLLSNNWLVRTLSRIYVEILRNTPLLVQLILWYFVVFAGAPRAEAALEFPAGGVMRLPYRWIIYVIVGLVLAFATQSARKENRNGIIIGGLAAASILEIGLWRARLFYLSGIEGATAWANRVPFINLPTDLSEIGPVMASVATARSNLLMGVALVLLAVVGLAVWRFVTDEQSRPIAMGAVGGVLVGALLLYLDTLPRGAFAADGVLMSLSSRGFYLPELIVTPRYPIWLAFIGLGIILAVGQWFYFEQVTERTGKQFPRLAYGIIALLVLAVMGWFLAPIGAQPITTNAINEDTVITVDEDEVTIVIEEEVTIIKDRNGIRVIEEGVTYTVSEALRERIIETENLVALETNPLAVYPVLRDVSGRRYVAGSELTPEYMAVLVGLVVYTSAFIAEIVRAGIQAVPKGQREAANAVGLSANDTLSLIILPQALRVIIPPMGNQYLNLAKNSSLAIVASYADIYTVMNTVINQSGQSVSGIVLIMVSYLIISLVISLVMNIVNQRFQLVTR